MSKFMLSAALIVGSLVGISGAGQGGVPSRPIQVKATHSLAQLQLYGPFPTREACAADAAGKSYWMDYLYKSPPGVNGVRVVGFRGQGWYHW